ncbi:MAG: membrane protein [Rhodothalassiaceae bacterium]|nr:MAG: membrane protein [Rhodothalassiaceae bacterium]
MTRIPPREASRARGGRKLRARRLLPAGCALLLCTLAPAPAPAGTVTFQSENDLYGDGEDRWYTNGARLVVTWRARDRATPWPNRASDALLRLSLGLDRADLAAEPHAHRHLFALGQNMYTPRTIKVASPLFGDRPYAGWLYLEAGSTALAGDRRDEWLISAGVVGPAALARQTQTAVHELVDSPRPLGWANQLPNSPALQLAYRQSRYLTLAGDPEGAALQLAPFAGAEIGTVSLAADAGVVLRGGWRIGRRLPARIGPMIVGSPFVPEADRRASFEVFAGLGGRLVGWNRLLQGPFLRDAPVTVPVQRALFELTIGGRLSWRHVALTYGYTLRGKEFRGQSEGQAFGHAGLSISF